MTNLGYARASTDDQSLEDQERVLRAVGCSVVFREVEPCTKKSREQLNALLDVARTGDTIIVTGLDQLGRSVSELIRLISVFEERGFNLWSLREQLDTHAAAGGPIFQVFSAIAEFERNIISERTQRGLAAARANGRTGGRPPLLNATKLSKAVDLIDNDKLTRADVARVLSVSEATLRRALKDYRK